MRWAALQCRGFLHVMRLIGPVAGNVTNSPTSTYYSANNVPDMPLGPPSTSLWRPTKLLQVVESYDTSMGTTKIKTDATFAYVKAMGNRQGPHALATEYVASSLARWFGLTVPDFGILDLPPEVCFELPRGHRVQSGPAFVSRHVQGRTWGGSEAELRTLENVPDITRLMVFDTWVRNCDRYPPDPTTRKPNYENVYLADTEQPGRSRLLAIDHTHCFDRGRDLSERLGEIASVRDEYTYGLFPSFVPFIDLGELHWCMAMLRTVTREQVEALISRIPTQWEVSSGAATALAVQIHARAGFVADRIVSGWPERTAAGSPESATDGG